MPDNENVVPNIKDNSEEQCRARNDSKQNGVFLHPEKIEFQLTKRK
jgi:hypothetical protein